MLRHLRFLARLAAASLAVAVFATGAFAAPSRAERAAAWERFQKSLASASPLKRLQVQRLLSEPMREREERRERRREKREQARELRRGGPQALVRRGERLKPENAGENPRLGPAPAIRLTPAPARVHAPPGPNVRANNTAGDFAGEAQSETSIASWGNYMIAAWNDSKGLRDGSQQVMGWGTSTDGGVTWTDQGTLPVPVSPGGWRWVSDPVVSVNPSTGAFFFGGLAQANGGVNALGVLKGRFSGGTFTWTTRSAARVEDESTDFLDKEWLAVDPSNGRVYLTCTDFVSGLDRIDVQSADSSLSVWTQALTVSQDAEAGYVQGSRPIVGPGGTVYVTYYAIGLVDVDYLRICRSVNSGSSFTTPTNAASFYNNFGTGAPGFNRDDIVPSFPSIAVDRSTGAHQGRLYLSWSESLNWYDDEPAAGTLGQISEVEPNDAAGSATAFTPGRTLRGALSPAGEADYFAVTLSAGQTLLVEADSASVGSFLWLRMLAADGTTRLALGSALQADIAAGARPGWIWTAPANGTYFVQVTSKNGLGGGYRLRTGLALHGVERGSDQRDVFVAHSDNGGISWSTPVRVDDAPVGYDGWLPEVAVGPDGRVYCAWYDWRDAAAAASGGESSIYLARSSDGGGTWTPLGAASDALSLWTNCLSYIAPNQGDYMSLFTSTSALVVCWSDARGGTPDTYVSVWPFGSSVAGVTLVSATAVPGRVDLDWVASPPDTFHATLYRSTGASELWTQLDTLSANVITGHVLYSDTAVALGTSYTYRLGVVENGTEQFRGQVTVLVPSGLAMALRGVFPNPTDGANAVLSFTLPYAEPATIAVFDLAGRLVHSEKVTGLGAASHLLPFADWRPARSGVYIVRLTQHGRSLSSRVTLIR